MLQTVKQPENGGAGYVLVVVMDGAYQVVGTLIEWVLVGDFYLAAQDFRIGIPGMLLQIFGGYALLKAIAKR